MADTRLAFKECFARIDEEFLQKAEDEVCDVSSFVHCILA